MPVPRWVARINRRVFNPMELKRGSRPVVTHVGRSSGRTFRTPLDAHSVDGGYMFFLMYGSGSDWVQNVLAAGSARLKVGGDEFELISPRVVGQEEAQRLLPAAIKFPPGFLKVTEYLHMDIKGD